MGFQRPELLLLLLPVAWLWWRTRDAEVGTRVLRALTSILLVAGLAGPYLSLESPGRDLVIVIDRSRSMTPEAGDSIEELLRLAEDQREVGDRVAILTFGARPALERPLSEEARFGGFTRLVHVDGTDLARALEAALELIPPERAGSILLLSDGEVRGRDPLPTARRAFGRDVRIDVRPYTRELESDLAVERIDLPEVAASGEPFQFSAWVRSDRRVEARYELIRDGEVLTGDTRTFEPGLNRLLFRDVVDASGVARYGLHVLGVEDRVPENNAGLAALRVEGRERLLVVNHDGREDTLVRALRRSGLLVDVAAPERAPLDRISLEAYRAVVLENVAANRIARHMQDLRRFVQERGGGLLLTGGQASFGIGGYYLSPLDETLPVSMELRKEQRKQGMALVIAMDRSGSMGVDVGGATKMDLANAGSAAAIEILSEVDSISVIAVDTAADVVQRMTPVENPDALIARVLRISPGGGGINTRTALEAAVRELEGAEQLTKHVTLFADAADANEQEGCELLVGELAQAGVTLSVIALGTPEDQHADFLGRLATIGQGEIYFTTVAGDLPRLFAQDTITATRSTFIDVPTEVRLLPDLYALGEIPGEVFPTIGGYNLTYLREGGIVGLVAQDEFSSPVFAFQYEGLGRTAVYTGQVGGTYGGEVVAWEGFSAFFVTVSRWLLGQEAPEDLHGNVSREGREAVMRVEVDPTAPIAADLSGMEALFGRSDLDAERRGFRRLSAGVFEARFELEEEGIVLPTLAIDERRSLRLAPISLPYSPEYEPSPTPDRGERLMRRLAAESAGEVTPAATALFRGESGGRAWRGVTREVLLLTLILGLLEICFRRLALWRGVDWAAPLRRLRGEQRAEREEEEEALEAHEAPVEALARPAGKKGKPARHAAALTGHAKLADALSRARKRAKRELGG